MFKSTTRKVSSTVLVACLFYSVWFSPHAGWADSDTTKILVNDVEISSRQRVNKRRLLEFERGLAMGSLDPAPGARDASNVLDEDATAECIKDVLALGIARRHKLVVTDADIDQKILERRELKFRLPPERSGPAWQALRSRVRRELAMRQFARSNEGQYGLTFKDEEDKLRWIAKRLDEERNDALIEY